MITIMASSDVAVQGEVIKPARTSVSGASFPAHSFFNVLRDIVRKGGVYHAEEDVRLAVEAITKYESHVVDAKDQSMVLSEDDIAPIEDVSKRRPPNAVGFVPGRNDPIDYERLARMMLAIQAEQSHQAKLQQAQSEPEPDQEQGTEQE